MAIKVSAPSYEALSSLVAQLQKHLDSKRRDVLDSVGFCDFCAVDTVVARQRPAGRIIIRSDRSETTKDLISKLGISVREARFRLRTGASVIPGTDHRASVVDGPDGDAVVYFALSDTIAEAAELASIKGDQSLLGTLFGYPPCCTRFYMNASPFGSDCTPPSITSLGPFPREMNPLIPHLFGSLTLIFHFPCSPWCKGSRLLWKERELHLIKVAPEVRKIASLGSGIAIYSPKLGISIITKFIRLTSSDLRAIELVTGNPTAHRTFGSGADVFTLMDHRSFVFDGVLYEDPGQFIAEFN